MPDAPAEQLMIERVRTGDERAWEELIGRYEGRLHAYVNNRLRDRGKSEDVVQETFVGFLVSLPNYDPSTPLDTFLFSIAAHKLTDLLRREGRRPTVPLFRNDKSSIGSEPVGKSRRASSLMRSRESKVAEKQVLADALRSLIQQWRTSGDWERLRCIELLFPGGWPNKTVAKELGISEQAVANHKQFVVSKLKEAAKKARLRDFRVEELGLE
ncbi:RNA polymerase sigma factor [Calycomorphotria hydatis]|uniref:ECF RNA polymerase sigma-E factor n=1 Tax=Calycomorphotria hydatis TaxID=2528027 RepID=A0A517T4S4_9PLAN|nr:sigma-70 family RNA polymerase sigma factor [Calycomorphotria hydatis]QDT63351.1 ECF RNA polymerase sigma-E factor [Calycomorphotria hydatis]